MASLERANKDDLHGVVDMGSNGIRFSISDLSQPTTRLMPLLFQDRAVISLYDAQFSDLQGTRHPIPNEVISGVISRLRQFKTTCEDFGVPPRNIHVLATEATRIALNAVEFISRIKAETGWDTRMLSKEDEGRLGVLGVASSAWSVEGLVMDLGGGSTQINWMMTTQEGVVTTSPKGSVSLPYGTAALTKRLDGVQKLGTKAEKALKEEMVYNFQKAYRSIEVPESLRNGAGARGEFNLYLCGGGFRGWGYILMNQSKINPYPISIINGFRVTSAEFYNTAAVLNTLSTSEAKIFRVSKRRASQVPAVAFLINILADALPSIDCIQFCQGGVREGFLYSTLSAEIWRQDPLLIATVPYAPRSASAILDLLASALPSTSSSVLFRRIPLSFTSHLLSAFTNLLFAHSSVPRESRPAAALYSTTFGILASANGLEHLDRALLALMLSERWVGDVAPAEESFWMRLGQVVSLQEAWWCKYLGRVATLVGSIYPAGVIASNQWRFQFKTSWRQATKKKWGTTDVLVLRVTINNRTSTPAINAESLQAEVERIEKLGKRKNWIKAKEQIGSEKATEDYGVKVEVELHDMS